MLFIPVTAGSSKYKYKSDWRVARPDSLDPKGRRLTRGKEGRKDRFKVIGTRKGMVVEGEDGRCPAAASAAA